MPNKINKEAITLKFNVSGIDCAVDILNQLVGRTFQYDDQDGSFLVQLQGASSSGLVTLIDLNKKTMKPKINAHPYTVDLFCDGKLTYL